MVATGYIPDTAPVEDPQDRRRPPQALKWNLSLTVRVKLIDWDTSSPNTTQPVRTSLRGFGVPENSIKRMHELMYDHNSLLICGILLLSLVLSIEAGYRFGRRAEQRNNDSSRAHVGAIQASLLGVLALLLGFTFSLSLQRFDSRSEAVIEEANAIGTAYLRAQLLADSIRGEVQTLLRRYVDLRVQTGTVPLNHEAERQALIAKTNRLLNELWRYARRAAEEDGRAVSAGLFIQSLNELIDAYGRRDAALSRHVPEVVLFLLYGTFLMTGGVVGYAAGVGGHRPSIVTYILVILIVVLTFIIIDLDRPRRGLIQVNQSSLVDLGMAIDAARSTGRP